MTADQLHIGGAPELEAWSEERQAAERRRAALAKKAPRGFDPAALFLLELLPVNLFDPTADPLAYRCKGCGDTVRRWKRDQHHGAHKRTANRGG